MNETLRKCRLCLKLGDFCYIFKQDDSVKLSDMVMAIANVKIYEDDGLPDRVCPNCIEVLSSAYLFKFQCERNDEYLRRCHGQKNETSSYSDCNDFMNKDFHIHKVCGSVEGENDHNLAKDGNLFQQTYTYETSDDTDSDVDSVKCVYCSASHNNVGMHKCHVTCTIEHNEMQRSSSNETLVAEDYATANSIAAEDFVTAESDRVFDCSSFAENLEVSCVLCDEKYTNFESYATHLNKCIMNVKLHHFVCPVCHEIFDSKHVYLDHLKIIHFKVEENTSGAGEDCVDFAPTKLGNINKPKPVRRQIGWSVEDIYQEIEYKKIEKNTSKASSTSSPFKSFLSRIGNESFSRQSTPKKVSFRKFFENGREKTTNFSFRKYIQNYKQKKNFDGYSPIKGKMQINSSVRACIPELVSDSDYGSPSGTSEESWKLKQNLICACDKKIFMLSEAIVNRDRVAAMINELGGVVAENTKMEMLSTHFVAILPDDTLTGMMVCALATGKWLLHVNFIYDSFRCKKFINEDLYEWKRHPKILELDSTSVEVAKAAIYWHLELKALSAKFPFEGKQIVLIMKKKYRQYYQMIFKTLKAKTVTYDPRTPGSCCSADYCFVDMKVIERVRLRFFARHNVPVYPYQYILVYLLKRGNVEDQHQYLLQECKGMMPKNETYIFNSTY